MKEMSYCVSHGKDKVMFLTEEDLKKPSSIVLPEDDEPRGFLLPNGEINWSCPCLGNMVVGPCSVEFRESISCFHKSTAEPKGSDCLDYFKEMNECMNKYPALYSRSDEDGNLHSLDNEEESMKGLEDSSKSIENSNRTATTDSSSSK